MADAAYNKVIKCSTDGVTYAVIDDIDDITLTMNSDVLDDTVFSTSHPGFRSRLQGLHDVSISISGNYSTSAGQRSVYSSWLNRGVLYIQVLPSGSSDGSGFQTTFQVESYEIAGAVGDKNTVSISLVGDSTGLSEV